MSDNVDKRIVEMEFDNAKFKIGIAETLEAIKQLDSSLVFKNGTNGFNDVAAAAKKVDFSDVAKGADEVGEKISGLKGIAQTAFDGIQSIAGGFMKGAGIASLIAGLPIIGKSISGGLTRAQKLSNAKFTMEGLGVEWKDIYNDINNAVDGTAYGLDSAASAAASLVASGVSVGTQMETTLKSIAGLAAMTNSDYDSIANIMTTVAGQGKLMTMQLRQLEMRGFNAAASLRDYFRQIPEFADITEGEIRDMVSEGEITFDIFADAMSKYADQAEKANDTFNGAMSNIGAALSRTTADFFEQVMGTSGVVPLLNDVRVAINALNSGTSGLMHYSWDKETGEITSMGVVIQGVLDILQEVHRSFGDVFGIVEEKGKKVAKGAYFEAWKETFETLAPLIKKTFDFFKAGTYDFVKTLVNFTAIFREVFRIVLTFATPIIEAFDTVFGTVLGEFMHTLSEGSGTVVDFLHNVRPAQHTLDLIRMSFTALLTPLRIVTDIVGGALYTGFNLFALAGKFVYEVIASIFEVLGLAPFGTITGFVDDLNKASHSGITGFFDTINKGLIGIQQSDPVILNTVRTVVGGIATALSKLGEALKPMRDLFSKAFSWVFEKFSSYGAGIGHFFDTLWNSIGDFGNKFKNFAGPIAEALINAFSMIGNDVKDLFDKSGLSSFIKSLSEGFSSVLENAMGFFEIEKAFADTGDNAEQAGGKVGGFTSKLKEMAISARNNALTGLGKAFEWIRDRAREAWEFVAPFASSIGSKIGSIWSGIVESFKNSGISLEPFKDFIKSTGELVGNTFGDGISIDKIIEFFSGLKDRFFDLVTTAGPQFAEFMVGCGNAVREQMDGPFGQLVDFAGQIGSAFAGIPGILQNVPGAINSLFSSMAEAIRNPFANVFGSKDTGGTETGFQDAAEATFDFTTVLDKWVKLIKHPWDTVYNFFTEGLGAGLTAIGDSITDGISNFPVDQIKLFVSEVSGIAIDAGLIYGLFSASNMLSQASKVAQNARDLIYDADLFVKAMTTSVKNISDAITKDIKAQAFMQRMVAIGAMFLAIAGALYIVSQIKDPVGAAVTLGIIAGVAVAISFVISKWGGIDPTAIGKVSVVALSLGVAMLALAGSLAIMTFLAGNENQFKTAVGAMIAMLAGVGVLLGILGHFSNEGLKASAMLMAFTASLGGLAAVLTYFAVFPAEAFETGAKRVGLAIAAMVVPLLALSAVKERVASAAISVAAFAAALVLMAYALKTMQNVKADTLISSLVQLGLGLLVIAGVAKAIAAMKVPETLIKVSVSMILIAAAMTLLASAMASLVGATGGDVGAAAGLMIALSVGLIAMAGALKLAGGPQAIASAAGILIAVAALSALMVAVWAMSQLPFDRIAYGLGLFAVAIAGLAAIALFVNAVAVPLAVLDTTLTGLGVALLLIAGSFVAFGLGLELIAAGAPAAIDGIIQAFDKFQEGIEGREDKFLNFCNTMGRSLAEVVIGFMSEMGKALDNWFQTWVPDVSGMIENLARIFGSVVSQLGPILLSAIQGLGGMIMEATAQIMGDAGRAGVSSINGELQSAYDDYDWAKPAEAVGEGAAEGAAEGVKSSGDAVSDAMSEVTEQAGKDAAEAGATAVEENLNIDTQKAAENQDWDQFAGVIDDNVIEALKNGDLGENFNLFGADMGEATSSGVLTGAANNPIDPTQLLTNMNLTSDSFNQQATDTGQGIGSAVSNGAATSMSDTSPLNSAIDAQTQAIESRSIDYENAGLSNGRAYSSGTAKAIGDSNVDNAVSASMEALEKGVYLAGKTGTEAGSKYGSEQAKAISALATLVSASARESIYSAASESDPGGAGYQSAVWYGEGNVSGMNAFAGKVSNTAKNIVWDASSVSDPGGAGHRGGVWYGEGLGSGVKATAYKMSSAAASSMRQASSDSDPGGKGYQGGIWFAEGMASGIDATAWKVVKAAKNMIKDAKKGADEEADSHSPSKEMIKRGNWFGEGFAIGIKQMSSMVTGTAAGMVDGALDVMDGSVSLMNAIVDEIDFDAQPTIRPVLDLDDVESGMSNLDSMLNVDPTIRAAGYATGRMFGDSSNVNQNVQNGGNNITVVLDWKAGTTPNQMAQALAVALDSQLSTEG